jgi:hypothetical protein
LVISYAPAYLEVAQNWHNFASAVTTNIPKRRHKTSGTLDADRQGIYHHKTDKNKALMVRWGFEPSTRLPGQEKKSQDSDLSDISCMSVIQRQGMNGNPNSDVRCYFVALGDLSIDLLGH